MHSSSSPSRFNSCYADEDVAIKSHCNCKIPLPLKVQVAWTNTNLSRRFKECSVRKCELYGFIDDELPSQYYKDLLLHQYAEFSAPSSNDDLPAHDIDGELPSKHVGEMEVSKHIVGMLEEELRMLKSNTKFHDRIILVLATVFVIIFIVFAKIMT
ncbi:hypothetical protein Tco_0838086 [Tanacetum coccineum]|uniref:Uncharacterized protein n=1 Tax=Tanacetum coccineum TaxID=301880 RepID=A0ABQ5ART2_9ASTR